MRPVSIVKALNGLIVTVGCTTLVFNDVEEFLAGLRNYIKNPVETEKEWLSRYPDPSRVEPVAVPTENYRYVTAAVTADNPNVPNVPPHPGYVRGL